MGRGRALWAPRDTWRRTRPSTARVASRLCIAWFGGISAGRLTRRPRTLLAAVRPLPGDPVAPVIATVLNLPSDPTTDEARRDLLTGLLDEQRPQSPTRSWRP
jgi:hypothetical protein